jgi:hypothetical protein
VNIDGTKYQVSGSRVVSYRACTIRRCPKVKIKFVVTHDQLRGIVVECGYVVVVREIMVWVNTGFVEGKNGSDKPRTSWQELGTDMEPWSIFRGKNLSSHPLSNLTFKL